MSQDESVRVRIAQKLCNAIKSQIFSGVLAPGTRLPSTRALAVEWGVSRTTVTDAYEQLAAEGYLETRQGARATVAHGIGNVFQGGRQKETHLAPPRLSAFGRRTVKHAAPFEPSPTRLIADFHYGDLSADDFPMLAWKKAATSVFQRRQSSLRYNDPAGRTDLRSSLQGYLWRARGLRCDADQIVIVNGSQQGLDLCTRILVDPGDRVIMENPGYGLARQTFLASGATVVPRDVDREGMVTTKLPDAKLVHVTPSHQYPLGSVMTAPRRRALLEWTQFTEAYIIEDDYDGEYRFDINPIPPLYTMGGHDRVIYLGTISKTLSPTLRLGYLVAPRNLVEAISKAKRLTDRHTPAFEQETLSLLIDNGAYERHVRRARRKNADRRAALLAALSEFLADRVVVAGADAGLHVVAWLRDIPREREMDVIARGADAGVGLYPVSPLYAPGSGAASRNSAGLVMGYASLELATIRNGVKALKRVLDSFGAESPMKSSLRRSRSKKKSRESRTV